MNAMEIILFSLLGYFLIIASLGCGEKITASAQNDQISVSQKEIIRDKMISLVNFNSALCLTLAPNGSLIQEQCESKESQLFWINKVKGETFRLMLIGKGCVELNGPNNTYAQNGVTYKIAPCSNSENQYFRFQQDKDDYLYRNIISVLSGKCMDVKYRSVDEGAVLHQWSCDDGSSSQNFLIDESSYNPGTFPKKVWMYWNSGEANMPNFHKANLRVWRERLGPQWQITVLNNIPGNENFIGNYIDLKTIPTEDYLSSKIGDNEANGKLKSYIVFSDFVRLAVLHEHGGLYADASIMLHRDFNEFIHIFENFPSFSIGGYVSPHQATRGLRFTDSLENFLLFSRPKTKLVKTWLANFNKYWKVKEKFMDIHDHPMFNGEEGLADNFSKTYGDLRNYLNQHLMFRYTLLKNPEFINEVFVRGKRGLGDNGPFALLELVGYDGAKLLTLSPAEINDFKSLLSSVNISKFASENTVSFKDKPEEFFFDVANIFGALNQKKFF